jgi:hypothetical protein
MNPAPPQTKVEMALEVVSDALERLTVNPHKHARLIDDLESVRLRLLAEREAA